MAAGLGFKDFTTGEVLTAADVDGYLMQGVWVFASAAARDAAVTSPQEGNFAYLKDTNTTTYYTGSAWANLDTTGMVNPMTTTGDTIYSSSGSTPARLGIGSTGQVLTVAGGLPSWATPASGGGMTLINTGGTTLTGASVTISSIPATYKNLELIVRGFTSTTDDAAITIRFNGDANTRYYSLATINVGATTFNDTFGYFSVGTDSSVQESLISGHIPDYANTTTRKMCLADGYMVDATTTTSLQYQRKFIAYNQTAAINSITLLPNVGNFNSGTAFLYGVQ